MPSKKGVGRVSKPAVTPSGRASRRGRFTAIPRGILMNESTFKPENNSTKVDGWPSSSQEKAAISTPATPQIQDLQAKTMVSDLSSTEDSLVTSSIDTKSTTASVKDSELANADALSPELQSSTPAQCQVDLPSSRHDSREEPSDTQPRTLKSSALHRLTTPETQSRPSSDSPSSLSSVPESLGSTPEGISGRQQRQSPWTSRGASPVRRSMRIRKRGTRVDETDAVQSPQKKRRITQQAPIDVLPSIEESPAAVNTTRALTSNPTVKLPVAKSTRNLGSKRTQRSRHGKDNVESSAQYSDRRPRASDEGYGTLSPEKILSTSGDYVPVPSVKKLSKAEQARENRHYAKLAKEVFQSESTVPNRWTKFDRNKVIIYGSDAQTQYTSAFATEPARRGGKTNGRGSARGGRGGAGNGKGRSSKGRGKGRDEDSPEPPQPRRPQTQEETLIIKHAKARQAELRKFFSIVGNQQGEILDIMSSQNLTRIAKKARAHKQVPEYDAIVEQIDDLRDFRQDLVRKEYELAIEAEMQKFEAEKEVIERSYKTKAGDLQEEYTKGAQGDIIIFRRATATAQDETRTQDGSDSDCLPRYNDFPEPNQSIRGYTSTRFMDERPFKHHLPSYDDQARREVIGDDIIGPIAGKFIQKMHQTKDAEARRRTQTMAALAEVAEEQLQAISGYLIPRPLSREEDMNSYALSCLADVSDWMAQRYPNKQYMFMPLEDGDDFPREALNFDRLPGYGVAVPQPPVPPPRSESAAQRVIATKPPQPATQPTRRSLRNLQPNGPVNTPQPQHTPPTTTSAAPVAAAAPPSGPGQTLAPAPPKLAPAFSAHSQRPRPSPIDTKVQNVTPPERSPVRPPSNNQSQVQQPSGLPSIQPRHMSQTSLPPPPPPPHYGYPPPFSPTHPPPQYAQHPHHSVPLPYPYPPPPQPSPYHHHQHAMPPSPYMQHNSPYHHYPPTYYLTHQPPPHQAQQQYSFMPPQQGPAPSQASPAPRPHSRSRSNAAPSTPTGTAPSQGAPPPQSLPPSQQPQHHHQQQQQQQQQQVVNNNDAYNQNGYHPHSRPHDSHQQQQYQQQQQQLHHQQQQHHHHTHHRSISHPHPIPQPHNFQPPPPPLQPQTAPPPPHSSLPTPTHTTSTGKSRARAKAKQPVTFVNQTLATRKAAAEQLAKEEAQAAAERREKERATRRDTVGSGNSNGGASGNIDGRKLAPKP